VNGITKYLKNNYILEKIHLPLTHVND